MMPDGRIINHITRGPAQLVFVLSAGTCCIGNTALAAAVAANTGLLVSANGCTCFSLGTDKQTAIARLDIGRQICKFGHLPTTAH